MEAIGLAGSLLGIIEVATRCISSLVEIRKRFQEINLTIELLFGQLVTVKAALSQIDLLIVESLTQNEQHYQLTMDLGVAIGCCNLLIRLLDEQIAKLQYSDLDELTFVSKVNLMLESRGTEECLTRLDRQINALNLLIIAFKCRSPRAQQDLLVEEKSRRVFDQVKDDSASLIVLCDSASLVTKRTKTTTATSKFSMNFSFDAEILQAKAYKTTLRSLMRRAQNNGIRNSNTQSTQQMSPDPPRRPRRHVRISAPENPLHITHVGYDEYDGRLTGLPSDWAKILREDNVIGFNERRELEEYVQRTSLNYAPDDDPAYINPRNPPNVIKYPLSPERPSPSTMVERRHAGETFSESDSLPEQDSEDVVPKNHNRLESLPTTPQA